MSRIEAALGGRPARISGRLIEWGGVKPADEEEIANALQVLVKNGNDPSRH